jgi:hypothetical protein
MDTNKNKQFVCLPTGYTIALYSGIKCLCIMSKFDNQETLLCIPISLINVNYFSIKQEQLEEIVNFFGNDANKVKTWNNNSIVRIRGSEQIENFELLNIQKLNVQNHDMIEILASFLHTPYTPFIVVGDHHIINGTNRKVALFKTLISWENIDESQLESKPQEIKELFFDIETEVTTGEFPIPSKEGITCISYCINDADVEVLTVLPAQQLFEKYSNVELSKLPNIILCQNQMELINNFILILLKCDRYISYNGSNFDIPFIIGVIERLDPHYWTKLSTYDGRFINIGEHYVETPVGPQIKKFISIPGIEHVDVINAFRRYYPIFMNHKLDTVAKELIDEGKSGFTMRKYFTLIEEYKKGKPLSPNGLELMKGALEYSGVDTEILKKIYYYVSEEQLIAINDCGLNIQSWSTTNEMIGLITKINPTLLFSSITNETKLNLEIGFHCDVKIFLFTTIALECIRIPEIKNALNNIKNKIILNTIFSSLYLYSNIFDYNLYISEVNKFIDNSKLLENCKNIGNYGLFIYLTNIKDQFKQFYVYSYDVIIIPTKASYLRLNEIDSENYNFNKNGLSTLSKPLPKKLDLVLCQQIMKIYNKIKNNKTSDLVLSVEDIDIEKLLFPKNEQIFIDDFTFVSKVRSDNAMKYEKLLTQSELIYLQNGGAFVEIYYLYIADSNNKAFMNRVYYPYKKDLNIIPDYYIELIQKHFEALNKIVKPYQTSKNKVIKKIIDSDDEDGSSSTIKELDTNLKSGKISKKISKKIVDSDDEDDLLNNAIKKEIDTQNKALSIRRELDVLQSERTKLAEKIKK